MNDLDKKLIEACGDGEIELAEKFLDKGANVDVIFGMDDSTLLMAASMNGLLKQVLLLLSKEADVDIEDNEGNTALMYASRNHNIKIAKLLIERDARIFGDRDKFFTDVCDEIREEIEEYAQKYEGLNIKGAD